MAELLVRPALNDHVALADVVTPSSGGPWSGPRAADRIVVDAHVVERRPQFATVASEAGVPFMVDPVTPLLQGEVDPDDKWVSLPFGEAEAVRPEGLRDRGRLRSLAVETVEFQLEHGATAVIPPYPYVVATDDPWFSIALELIRETADYLDLRSPGIAMLPVLCAQLQAFSPEPRWPAGLDRFTHAVKAAGGDAMALCVSPAGASDDSYGKVHRMFRAAARVKASGLRVLAWRQGVYGPALVALGLDGYETGMGTGETTNVSAQQSRRRPKSAEASASGGGGGGIYLEPLGRSVPRNVGQRLLGHVAMRPKLMCEVESCCPTVAATLDGSRQHALRSRSRYLRSLEQQPHARWRLNQVSRDAQQAATLAKQASKLLASDGERPARVNHKGFESLARVTAEMGQAHSEASA